jgi:hypothetical protein
MLVRNGVPFHVIEDMDEALFLAWQVAMGESESGREFDFDEMRWRERPQT